jgi:hypothetical protein
MWLHIRGVGEWTNRLYNYFECEQEKLHNVGEQLAGNRPLVINGTPEPKGIKRLQAYVQYDNGDILNRILLTLCVKYIKSLLTFTGVRKT